MGPKGCNCPDCATGLQARVRAELESNGYIDVPPGGDTTLVTVDGHAITARALRVYIHRLKKLYGLKIERVSHYRLVTA